MPGIEAMAKHADPIMNRTPIRLASRGAARAVSTALLPALTAGYDPAESPPAL